MTSTAQATLVVFAKAPEVGRVKTRLVPPFTLRQAADFYAAMLADVLAATLEFSRELGLEGIVAVHPWERRRDVAKLAPAGLRIVPQRGADLSARMAWAVREAAAGGNRRILLRGSDSPLLDGPAVAAALAELRDFDLVLRPDLDGGYALVGLRTPAPGLFAHPMSTRSALEDTLANARRLSLRSFVAEAGFDIDTVPDLARLAAARSGNAASRCPRTLAFLDGNALWPERVRG